MTAEAPVEDRDRVVRARDRFRERFGAWPDGVAIAPGRVNLIGDHTDYSDGFVLPIAIDRVVAVAFRRSALDGIHAFATLAGVSHVITANGSTAPPTRVPGAAAAWHDYVAGVRWAMGAAPIGGCELLIDGDLPAGVGLSSSAALEVAVYRALCAAAGLPWDPIEAATLCRRAENDYVGVACGIMDQLTAAAGREGCALLIDCRTLAIDPLPLPAGLAIVVLDSGVRRSLSASAYNDRRAACERVVAAARSHDTHVRALRDLSVDRLEALRPELDPADARRAAHVIGENARVRRTADLLRGSGGRGSGRGVLQAIEPLVNASHASLRDLYEVSIPELERAVDMARAHPACHGARLTGAGFGGCVVAFVEAERVHAFQAAMTGDGPSAPGSGAPTGKACVRAFPVRASTGARVILDDA